MTGDSASPYVLLMCRKCVAKKNLNKIKNCFILNKIKNCRYDGGVSRHGFGGLGQQLFSTRFSSVFFLTTLLHEV
jgi:hypothetical protein